ncbi:MAG: hypothetical protein EA401_03350 [Planctomycetota bacterium]|nr:MAG: hypothetical protein EA401_03350 [Planctomycetota bacterium]
MGEEAPEDLQVGAWLSDIHGRWFQSRSLKHLPPGGHLLYFDLGPEHMLSAEGHDAKWDPLQARLMDRGGIFFFSQHQSEAELLIHSWQYQGLATKQEHTSHRLLELALPLDQHGQRQIDTG